MSEVFSIVDIKMPMSETYSLLCHRYGTGAGPRLTIVSGIHGDEFVGLGVCYLLNSFLNRFLSDHPDALLGTIDVLPSVNAIALDSGARYWPGYAADLNRRFPGNAQGSPPQRVPAVLLDFLTGADVCIDIHASNIYLQEIPQVRMLDAYAPKLIPLARQINMDLIWVHAASTVLETTLSYNLNQRGVPTLVVEMGIGLRYEDAVCLQLYLGILALLQSLGILKDVPMASEATLVEPTIASDADVHYFNAAHSGFFIPAAELWKPVKAGDLIGTVTDPLNGTVLDQIRAPSNGKLFTTRPFPMVYQGSLCGRMLVDAV